MLVIGKTRDGASVPGRASAYWKCVSFEVDPSIAVWCAWRCESLRMRRVDGVNAWVSWVEG